MRWVLAISVIAIVATRAVTSNIDVIEIGGQPRSCCVTVIAVVAAVEVCRMFARRNEAIVTRTATAVDLCVVNGERRYPGIRVMAVLTNVACLHVGQTLAGCLDTVVATVAVARNVQMIEIGRQPGSG